MRLLVGKLAISAYLLMLACLHFTDEILQNTLRQAVEANIAELSVHERTKEFLRLYLINAIYFAFATSALMVVSRNILPKVVCAVGLALWSYFSLPPGIPLQRILLKILEEICIMGGLLLIAGSEYIEASLFPSSPQEKEREE
jgi:hypothetical protein